MTEEKCPYLAGCVFYLLLRKAAYTGATARQHKVGIKDDHNNPIFMSDLVYTFTGTQTNISHSDISQYKNGAIEGGSYLPFNDQSDIASYDHVVHNRYPDALKRMREFALWHLNPDKREWMVKACLELIENDNDILATDEFCIKGDGAFVSKENLRKETIFEYEPFLIGVLHYILTKRADKNALGVPTLDANTEKKKYKERKYNGHLGESITRAVIVNPYKEPTVVPAQKTAPSDDEKEPIVLEPEVAEEKLDDEVINDAIIRTAQATATVLEAVPQPKIDASALSDAIAPLVAATETYKPNGDVLAKGLSAIASAFKEQKHAMAEQIRRNSHQEESTSRTETPGADDDAAQESAKTTVIQQQTNVIQNGENNVNVTNNGTINFNF
ncbi:MAG: hypothetical protein IKM73_13595 [Acidaminococcaceae bacterium]|nr:hypothetical protein [Acidaminococcaceae bacterium]